MNLAENLVRTSRAVLLWVSEKLKHQRNAWSAVPGSRC